ncbi:MAG TPA: glycosyltransferase family 2 protein [Sphingobium sp.]
MAQAPRLAIVTVNYRTADLAIRCVEALAAERETVGPFDLFIVDGNSGDGSAEKLSAHFGDTPWITVLPLDFNGGFGWANNQAMLRLLQRDDPPDYIHLINPDAIVEPGAIAALLSVIESNPRVGAVASQLLEPDGRIAGSAFRFPSPGREFLRGVGLGGLGEKIGIKPTLMEFIAPGPAEWITGASVMFRSEALRQTGLFDDGFFLYFEEVELMHRMTDAGWSLWSVPASRVMHIGGAATGVASGIQIAVRPLPAYRYEARRRYFVRASGISGLIAANLSWLAGKIVGWPLRLLRGKGDPGPPRELSMTLRYCFWPSRSDRGASIPRWDEPPGRRPAWSVK